jgi:hypothetical protein
MKILNYALFSCLVLLLGCGTSKERSSSTTPCVEAAISKETAILIAKGDAIQAYTITDYTIIAKEQPKAWRITFELKDPGRTGAGPDYIIEKQTGKILNATYNK